MHYVMSDIHGRYDRYLKMLDLIAFSDADQLIILGDMADRNPGGLDIMRHAKGRDNIRVILGNHEHMLLETLGPHNRFGAKQLWFGNGGEVTMNEWLMCPRDEQQEFLAWLQQLPSFMEMCVGGREFHLVHGWPGDTVQDRVWGRANWWSTNPLEGKTLIIGHTPVPLLMSSQRAYLEKLAESGDHVRIFKNKEFIDIDCGCAMKSSPLSRLGCLRLEDMEEFYAD